MRSLSVTCSGNSLFQFIPQRRHCGRGCRDAVISLGHEGSLFALLVTKHILLNGVLRSVAMLIIVRYQFALSDLQVAPITTYDERLTTTAAAAAHGAPSPAFLIAQLAGAALAAIFCGWLLAIDENE